MDDLVQNLHKRQDEFRQDLGKIFDKLDKQSECLSEVKRELIKINSSVDLKLKEAIDKHSESCPLVKNKSFWKDKIVGLIFGVLSGILVAIILITQGLKR